jgi:hypothetical protein
MFKSSPTERREFGDKGNSGWGADHGITVITSSGDDARYLMFVAAPEDAGALRQLMTPT